MDEKLKRIDEIRDEAKAINADEELAPADKIAKINELLAERKVLESEIELHNASVALSADAPELTAVPDPKEEPAPEEEPAKEEETPEQVVEVVPDPEDVVVAEEIEQPVALAAAVGAIETPAPEVAERPYEGIAIMASSTAGGMTVGRRMEAADFGGVHKHAAHSMEGTKQTFATVRRFEDDELAVSPRNSVWDNTERMYKNRQYDISPLTAAACFCGPFETKKDITCIGLDDRPVQGLFRTVPVTGPFNYIRELSTGDVAAGVNIWTCDDQEDVVSATPSTWKPCVDLTCQTPVQVDPYAIVACGLVATFQELSHPELVDDFVCKLGIQYARLAEQALLDEIRATSTHLTYGPATGHGLLWQLEKVLAHLAGLSSYGQRIKWSNYAIILPPGLIEVLIVDEHLRGFSQGITREGVLARLRSIGVGQIVEALDVDSLADDAYAAAAATFINPGTTVPFDQCDAIGDWTIYVVPVSSYTVGLSTMVEAGWTRDSSLIRQNLVQYFTEGLEFLEKVNEVPSYTLTLTGAGNGISSALALPADCVA